MDEYCGKEAVIEGIEEDHGHTGYRLDVDGYGCGYIWLEAWLTPIDSCDTPTKEEFDTEFDKLLM